MTQGMISIIENEKVKYKIVCGADGGNVEEIPEAELLKCHTPEELYNLAVRYECGGEACLVVSYLDQENRVQHYEKTDDLDHEWVPWYWDQFLNPNFNPRWARGICQHTRLVVI